MVVKPNREHGQSHSMLWQAHQELNLYSPAPILDWGARVLVLVLQTPIWPSGRFIWVFQYGPPIAALTQSKCYLMDLQMRLILFFLETFCFTAGCTKFFPDSVWNKKQSHLTTCWCRQLCAAHARASNSIDGDMQRKWQEPHGHHQRRAEAA